MQRTRAFTAAPFGEVIRMHRNEAGMTQEALAAYCDLHPVYISMLERGQRHPTLDKVFRIADALGLAPEVLIAEVRERLPNS